MRKPIDFLVFAPLPEERGAVLAELPEPELLPSCAERMLVYHQASVPVSSADGQQGSYSVIVFSPAEMSNVPAAAAIGEALRCFEPRYVLAVGIAGGVAGQAALGDVLIADQVAGYELQKLLPAGPSIRWKVFRSDLELLAAAKHRLSKGWWRGVRVRRPEKGRPELRFGPVASGDKVIASSDILASHRATWPKLIGVEMEAVGIASALELQRPLPGFLMIRGVSDLADEDKNNPGTDRWRAYACAIAARCAVALIQCGPVPFGPVSLDPSTPSESAPQTEAPNRAAEPDHAPSLLGGLLGHAAETGIRNLLGYYLGAEPAASPFGGRQRELAELNRWLEDASAPQRLLLCAPAGIGKTALLCQWLRRDLAARPGLRVAFYPISNRYDTHREAVVMPALLARLAHLHKLKLPDQRAAGSGAWRVQLHELLRRPLPDGQQLVLILDGLDEAADWKPDRTLLPVGLPGSVRIIAAARRLAGDEGESGWMRRLGWSPKETRPLTLGMLTVEETRDAALHLGLALRQDRESSAVVAALHKLTAGDPLVLRLRVEDLVSSLPVGALPELAQLRRLPKGLSGYLEDLCGPEVFEDGARASAPYALQSLVALAQAPLSREDLRALAPELASAQDWELALKRLRRILIGDGIEQGFVYSHSRLRDYFKDRLPEPAVHEFRERFMHYAQDSLAALQSGRMKPAELSLYLLTCTSGHLAEVGASAEQKLLLVCQEWMEAWLARGHGLEGFLRDVASAQEAAEVEFLRSRSEALLLGLVRCALCKQSIHDQLEQLAPALLRALLENELWAPARALATVRQTKRFGREPFSVQLESIAPFLSPELLFDAAGMVQERTDGDGDAQKALLALAPQLAHAQADRAVSLADCIEPDWLRQRYLAALLPALTGPLRESTLEWAQRLIDKEPGSRRANELLAVAQGLGPNDPRTASLFRASWQQGGQMDQKERVQLWDRLLPTLPPVLAGELLTDALDELLQHAELHQLAAAAGAITDWEPDLGRPILEKMAQDPKAQDALLNWASAAHDFGGLGRDWPNPKLRWQKLRERLDSAVYLALCSRVPAWLLGAGGNSPFATTILELTVGELRIEEREALWQFFQNEPSLRDRAASLCVLAVHGDADKRKAALAAALDLQRFGEDLQILGFAVALLDVDQIPDAEALIADHLASERAGDERARFLKTFGLIYLSDRGGPEAQSFLQQAAALARQLTDQPSQAQALYALAVRAHGEEQAELLNLAATCADAVEDPQRRYGALQLIALGLNEPWREVVLRHALEGTRTWSQRARWERLKSLLDRTEISSSLRSELRAGADQILQVPSDRSLNWHHYLDLAGYCSDSERRGAVQRAADAAQRIQVLPALVSTVSQLAPTDALIERLLARIAAEPSMLERLRLLPPLFPLASSPLQTKLRGLFDEALARTQKPDPSVIEQLAQRVQTAPLPLRAELCASLFALTRAFVSRHQALLQTPKKWLPSDRSAKQDLCAGALRQAAKALAASVTPLELAELLSFIPMQSGWCDVLGVLIARVEEEDRRGALFRSAWQLALGTPADQQAMKLAPLAAAAPAAEQSAAIAAALQLARIKRFDGASTDSRPPVLRALAAHLSKEHIPAVLKHLRDLLIESGGQTPALNLPYLLTQVPGPVRNELAAALLTPDSPLPRDRQAILRLVLAAADPTYLPTTLQDIGPLNPFVAARIGDLAPALSDDCLQEALALLTAPPPPNQAPAPLSAPLGAVAMECERRGWNVRPQLAQSTLQLLRTQAHHVQYLLQPLGDLAPTLNILRVRPSAFAETLVSVLEWFRAA